KRGQANRDGHLVADLVRVVVGGGGPVLDLTQPWDGARRKQERFDEARFAGAAVAEQPDIPNLFSWIDLHRCTSSGRVLPKIADKGADRSTGPLTTPRAVRDYRGRPAASWPPHASS